MGALLVRKNDNKPKTVKGQKAKKVMRIHRRNRKINWTILSKEEVEASRPKDAYDYVV